MHFENVQPGLRGQALVYESWRDLLQGRSFVLRDELDLSRIIGELAHVSVLGREEDGGFRFRLAGTALRLAFGREARGLRSEEVMSCLGQGAWCDALHQVLDSARPVSGTTTSADGSVHFWLRLPMSSTGKIADLVLCHDRILPAEALCDPEGAAGAADRALRRDLPHLVAA